MKLTEEFLITCLILNRQTRETKVISGNQRSLNISTAIDSYVHGIEKREGLEIEVLSLHAVKV